MATVVKCVIQFTTKLGWGWSETHYYLSGATGEPNLGIIQEDLKTVVVPARAALLGRECSVVGTRVSFPRKNAIASRSSRKQHLGSEVEKSTDMAQSLAVEFIDQSQTRSKITHLRGFWDSVEFDSSYHPEEGEGWDEKFVAWKNSMIGRGYGWMTTDAEATQSGIVNSYTTSPTEIVEFTVEKTDGPDMPIGKVKTVTFSRINDSNSVLNRTLVCEVKAADKLVTVAPIAAGAFTGKGKFKIRERTFVAYHETDSISVGKRPAGRPVNRSPGRSKDQERT